MSERPLLDPSYGTRLDPETGDRVPLIPPESPAVWTFGLVARLLPLWHDLEEGHWPADPNNPTGYKGPRWTASGGFEHAVEASADFWLAVERLRRRAPALAAAVVARYREGRTVPYRWTELAAAVLGALGG